MNILKNRYFRSIVLIVVLIGVFFFGAVIGGRVSDEYLAKKFNAINMPVMLTHYKTYRDIARALESQNLALAKCNSELNASVLFDALEACLKDKNCKDIIAKDTRETAPELEGKTGLGFRYLQTKEGVKVCN